MEYSIINYIEDKEIKLVFNSIEEKEKYVLKELAFCMDEYDTYIIAPKAKREDAKRKFHEARVLFAKKYGFRPKTKNSLEWIKMTIVDNDEPELA